MTPLVIYHANCTDGFGAAYAAWKRFGDNAEYVPLKYNQELKASVQGRDVYILDFSFPKDEVYKMAEKALSVTLIDHHLSAMQNFGYGNQTRVIFRQDNLEIIFDMNRSGALLAWDFFHPAHRIPLVISNIDDRDRWKFQLTHSKAVHAGLKFEEPWTFKKWEYLADDKNYQSVVLNGEICLKVFDAQVAQACRHAVPCTIQAGGNYWVGKAANSGIHQSEIGNQLATSCGTYALVWFASADGSIGCSLRSVGDFDVSEIAKVFGGGGHRNAAGFGTNLRTLSRFIAFKDS